jgi:hypothetical protein
MDNERPIVDLSRVSGNAFAIIAECRRAAKKAGWNKDKIDEFTKLATSGNYDNLLNVVLDHFEIEGL